MTNTRQSKLRLPAVDPSTVPAKVGSAYPQPFAAAVAARLIDLFKTTRAIYRMTLPRRALRRVLGECILVTHPRFDLRSGRLMRIVDWRLNLVFDNEALDTVELAAYG